MLANILELFLSYADVELGLAAASLAAYKLDISSYLDYCKTLGLMVQDADVNLVASYLQIQMQSGAAVSSVLRRMSALVTLYEFLRSRGMVRENPVKKLDMPERPMTLPDVLNRLDAEKLVTEGVNLDDPLALRNTAMLEVLYGGGLRVNELVEFTLSDWGSGLRTMIVHGKGGKDRAVPLHERAKAALNQYIDELRPRLVAVKSTREKLPTDIVFLSRAGLKLTRMAVWLIVRRASERAGIRPIHPHTLRHTLATHLLMGGANLRVIQEILGHSNLNTTQHYTHVDSDHLREIHAKFHPRQ